MKKYTLPISVLLLAFMAIGAAYYGTETLPGTTSVQSSDLLLVTTNVSIGGDLSIYNKSRSISVGSLLDSMIAMPNWPIVAGGVASNVIWPIAGTDIIMLTNAGARTVQVSVNPASFGTASRSNASDFQPATQNLTNWSALATSSKQDASANLTSWSSVTPSGYVTAPTNTGADNQVVSKTGDKTKWISTGGTGDMLAANNLTDVANSGTSRTNLGANNASNLSAGTVADARLSANVPLKNSANIFTASNTMTDLGVTGVETVGTLTFTNMAGEITRGSVTNENNSALAYLEDVNASTNLSTLGTIGVASKTYADNTTNAANIVITTGLAAKLAATTNGNPISPSSITNLSLTPSTIISANSQNKEVSVPNGTGALTNNGSGVLGWYNGYGSGGGSSGFTIPIWGNLSISMVSGATKYITPFNVGASQFSSEGSAQIMLPVKAPFTITNFSCGVLQQVMLATTNLTLSLYTNGVLAVQFLTLLGVNQGQSNLATNDPTHGVYIAGGNANDMTNKFSIRIDLSATSGTFAAPNLWWNFQCVQ